MLCSVTTSSPPLRIPTLSVDRSCGCDNSERNAVVCIKMSTHVMSCVRMVVHATEESGRCVLPNIVRQMVPAPRMLVYNRRNVMDEPRHQHELSCFGRFLDWLVLISNKTQIELGVEARRETHIHPMSRLADPAVQQATPTNLGVS